MAILLNKKLIESSIYFMDDGKYRPHLHCICFNYNDETKKLELVATNAQIMIKHEIDLQNDDERAFCKANFNMTMLPINKTHLTADKSKHLLIDKDVNGFILNGNIILQELTDFVFPKYDTVIPSEVKPLYVYASVKPEFLAKIDKALFTKNDTITTHRPSISKDYDTDKNTIETALVWTLYELENTKTTVLAMPMRLD